MANRLAAETSPYLRQHQDNPVDWYPWGEEALGRARALNRPLLVSVGYSACHWCHVMAHESFEDPATAELMNERFVCIKVDREERPDVDAVCMEACQAMTGGCGWPLNAFLTPDLVPFYAATYFPPQAGRGLPSWRTVLEAVAEAWAERRAEILQQSPQILASLNATARLDPSSEPIQEAALAQAVTAFETYYDRENGGFGPA
ncbi:MAG: thioredoxin domain-containing protein, partial [Solirubrobacterales bacterium]|nr:thioredoxin domain-containing protein [Solirubrobacterales bacterium]